MLESAWWAASAVDTDLAVGAAAGASAGGFFGGGVSEEVLVFEFGRDALKKYVAVIDKITVERVGTAAVIVKEAEEAFFVKKKEIIAVDDGSVDEFKFSAKGPTVGDGVCGAEAFVGFLDGLFLCGGGGGRDVEGKGFGVASKAVSKKTAAARFGEQGKAGNEPR